MKSKCGKFVLLDNDAKEMVDKLNKEIAELKENKTKYFNLAMELSDRSLKQAAHIERLRAIAPDINKTIDFNAAEEVLNENLKKSLFNHDSDVIIKMFKDMGKSGIVTSKRVYDFIDGYVIGQLKKGE